MHPLQAEALALKQKMRSLPGRVSTELEIVSEPEFRRRMAARAAAEREAKRKAQAAEEKQRREALAAVVKTMNAPQSVLWNPRQLFDLFVTAHQRTGFEYGMPPAKRALAFRQVLDATCSHFLVSTAAVIGVGRSATLTRPRQIAMFLAREHCGMTLPQIGRRLGKDHTTVMHGHRKISYRIADGDEAVIAAVTAIRKELGIL
jgi:hypothetical protein